MAVQSQNNPRVLTRGELTKFKVSFFADPAKTIPIIPLNPQTTPSYQIINIAGAIIQQGVGVQEGNAGYWLCDFQVAKDALLTNDRQRWRIEWSMLSNDNRQLDFIEEFDVRDIIVTADRDREIKHLALMGQPHLITLRQTVIPYSLSMTLLQGNSPVLSAKYPGDIQMRVDQNAGVPAVVGSPGITGNIGPAGDSYVFAYTIPGNILYSNCGYSILWTIQETSASPVNFEFQNIWSVSPISFQAMSSLRMLIDRFQKKLGRVQAYEDSDLYEYLQMGLQVVNAWYPTTYWPLDSLPYPMQPHWLLAAGWWALNAQHLLEVDMQFEFSGQTVTLNYDHTAGLDAAIGRYYSFLSERLPATKQALVRANSAVGTFAGRPTRLNALHNYVYKLQSFNSGGFVNLLSQIGLL